MDIYYNDDQSTEEYSDDLGAIDPRLDENGRITWNNESVVQEAVNRFNCRNKMNQLTRLKRVYNSNVKRFAKSRDEYLDNMFFGDRQVMDWGRESDHLQTLKRYADTLVDCQEEQANIKLEFNYEVKQVLL